MTRAEQVERNRGEVLSAARRVFEQRGYVGASLDAIAVEAGFSKGVVYSQFGSKADLFLAVLADRIEQRAAENDAAGGVEGILRTAGEDTRANEAWVRVLVEFRAATARDAELAERYAVLHARTVDRLAGALGRALAAEGGEPVAPPRAVAQFVLGVQSGYVLERIADPDALPFDATLAMIARAVRR